MDDSAIMCVEVIELYDEETKTTLKNFHEKKTTFKMENFYILLAFLSTTTTLLIAVSIYCYLVKY